MVHTLTDAGVRTVNTSETVNNVLSVTILYEVGIFLILYALYNILQLLTATLST